MKQNFEEGWYQRNILKDQIDKVDNTDWKDLLRKKKGNKDGNSSLIRTLENFQWCVNYKQWLECSSRKSGVAGNILEKSVCGI